jgi:hypothetical protein
MMVRSQLTAVDRIAVEIRPEGVLLRPEMAQADDDEALLEEMLPQDSPPEPVKRGLRRLFGRSRRS